MEGKDKIKQEVIKEFANSPSLTNDEMNGRIICIREGTLPDVEEKSGLKLDGTLESVADFAEKREFEEQEANIQIDNKAGTIRLSIREQFKSGITVTGSVIPGSRIEKFGINKEQFYSLESFAKLVRMNRMAFVNADNSVILAGIDKFNAERRISIKNENDRRGNVDVSLKATCQQAIEQSFYLVLPVYEGCDPQTVKVDVFVDVSDAGVKIWLESVELEEIREITKENLIRNTKTRILEAKGKIVVIEK